MTGRLQGRGLSGTAPLVAMLLASCATQPDRREAQELIRAGRIEEGIARLEQAVRLNPRDAQLQNDLLRAREQAIHLLVVAGDRARDEGRVADAEALYKRALGVHPENPRAKRGLEMIALDRRHQDRLKEAQALYDRNEFDQAGAVVRSVLAENPNSQQARTLDRQIEDAQNRRRQQMTPALKSKFKQPVTLEFRDAPLKMVFDALSRITGLNFIFDRDVRSDLRTTIFVRDEAVENAIDLLLMPNQLDKKVVSENTVLIYPGIPQKAREYQDLVLKTFYLGNADPKQVLNMVKTLLKTRDVYIDERLNLLMMRDTPEAIRLAEKLIAAQDSPEPEVMLEMEVIEISRSRLLDLGIRWPDTFTVLDPNEAPLLLSELHHLNAGRIGISPSPTLTMKQEDTDVTTLASPRIRVRNREKAKVHIGDRVPVVSTTQTPSTGGPLITESVQYIDVGLKLEVEPNVYLQDEVAIRVGLEVSSAITLPPTKQGSTLIQVSTRNASTVLRLKTGETQVLMGLIRNDENGQATKIPGLGEIPVLGRLFGAHRNNKANTEIMLAITPRIVRNVQPLQSTHTEFWSGTEASLRTGPTRSGGAAGQPGEPGQPGQPVELAPPGSAVPAPLGAPPEAPPGQPTNTAPPPLPSNGSAAQPSTVPGVPQSQPIPDTTQPPPHGGRPPAPGTGIQLEPLRPQ